MPTQLIATTDASQPIASKATSVAMAAQSASGTDLATWIKPFTPDSLANGFATLLGVLIGAMLAYALQRKFQNSLEHKKNLTAAHRLMFALFQQINTIMLIQRDYVYKEISNPGRFLSIPATPQFDTTKNVLELPELAFLLDTREGRTILYDFYLAQENYVEALNQWNIRSALHVEKVQPALAASGIENGSSIMQEALQMALGVHVLGSIVNSTENCIETLQRAFQKLAAVKNKARTYLVVRFNTNDFTDFDFPETFGLDADKVSEESHK
jgi:hypothetical protein